MAHDEHLIDWEEGITWDEFDASEDNVEDHDYKTAKDLAIAKSLKAKAYIDDIISYFLNDEKKAPTDPKVRELQQKADEIAKNLGNIFG